jgi:hypothetical protein
VPIKACLAGEDLDVLLAFDLPGGVMLVPGGVSRKSVSSGAFKTIAAWVPASSHVIVSSRFSCRRTCGSGCRRITSRGL